MKRYIAIRIMSDEHFQKVKDMLTKLGYDLHTRYDHIYEIYKNDEFFHFYFMVRRYHPVFGFNNLVGHEVDPVWVAQHSLIITSLEEI
jgi:hypothetical protein